MSIFNIFRSPPPPPPIYKRQPVATGALIFTIVATLVLGPVGYLWNGMAEELKAKADYNTVIILLEKQEEKDAKEEQIRKEREALQKEKDDRQWKAIEQIIQAPKGFSVKTDTPDTKKAKVKPTLTPEQFEKILAMEPDVRAKYLKYLRHKGYDTEGLE